MKTILVPLDGSARSEGALPISACIARHTGAAMVLVRVVSLAADSWQGIMTSNPLLAEALLETDLEEAARYLERMAASPTLAGHGPPAARILTAAVSSQSDLVVLCRHGAGGLTRWAIGSVAEKVAPPCHDPRVDRAGRCFAGGKCSGQSNAAPTDAGPA